MRTLAKIPKISRKFLRVFTRVVIDRVIRSSAEGTRSYHEANNALIFR